MVLFRGKRKAPTKGLFLYQKMDDQAPILEDMKTIIGRLTVPVIELLYRFSSSENITMIINNQSDGRKVQSLLKYGLVVPFGRTEGVQRYRMNELAFKERDFLKEILGINR